MLVQAMVSPWHTSMRIAFGSDKMVSLTLRKTCLSRNTMRPVVLSGSPILASRFIVQNLKYYR